MPTPPPARPLRHRTLADAPSLQALTHPTRLALIEAVAVAGSLTATGASAIVGETPTACAYHLRTLARLGFLEEAGGGHGRERPWRLAQSGLSFSEDSADPAVAAAADAASAALTERFIARIRGFELARSRYPAAVREATGTVQGLVFGTPEEAAALREQIEALLAAYAGRADPARRPPGAVPFEVIAFVHVFDTGTAPGGSDAPAAGDP